MAFDDQFRPAIDNLAARLRRDVELHMEAAVAELNARAETLAADAEAQRISAIEHASQAAWVEAEKATTERLSAQWAEAERLNAERQATEFAEAERAGIQRLAAERAEVERATIERLTQERAEAERVAADRIAPEIAAREHAMDERLAAAREDARAEATRLTADRFATEHAHSERALMARHTAEKADAEAQVRSVHQRAELAAGTRLVNAFRAIDTGQSLSDIMTTLVDAAAAEAERIALFLIAGPQVNSWRSRGFEAELAGDDSITLPVAEAGIIADAMESRVAVAGGPDTLAAVPAFAALPRDRRAVAVPLIVNDEVVGVVYADQGAWGEAGMASWASTIEILTRHASRALEALTAHRLAATLGTGATRPRTVATQAPVHAASPVSAAPRHPPAPHAEDAHTAAQRYAQLLVSEIRLAHEPEVVAGVRERDLMARLGSHIARAWGLYEERVPDAIRARTNYFHNEMVKTLADGDASLLSPQP